MWTLETFSNIARGTSRGPGMNTPSVPNGTICLKSANWFLKHAYRNDTTLQTLGMSPSASRKLKHPNENAKNQTRVIKTRVELKMKRAKECAV